MDYPEFKDKLYSYMVDELGKRPEIIKTKCTTEVNKVQNLCHEVVNIEYNGFKYSTSEFNGVCTRATLYRIVGGTDIKIAEFRKEEKEIKYYLPKKMVIIDVYGNYDELKTNFKSALSELKISLPKKYSIRKRTTDYGVDKFEIAYEGQTIFCTTLGKRVFPVKFIVMKNQGYIELRYQSLKIRLGSQGPSDANPLWRREAV